MGWQEGGGTAFLLAFAHGALGTHVTLTRRGPFSYLTLGVPSLRNTRGCIRKPKTGLKGTPTTSVR